MVTRQVSYRHSGITGNCNISHWKGVCTQEESIPRLFTDRGFFMPYLESKGVLYAGSI
jgi:hypothetical protein